MQIETLRKNLRELLLEKKQSVLRKLVRQLEVVEGAPYFLNTTVARESLFSSEATVEMPATLPLSDPVFRGHLEKGEFQAALGCLELPPPVKPSIFERIGYPSIREFVADVLLAPEAPLPERLQKTEKYLLPLSITTAPPQQSRNRAEEGTSLIELQATNQNFFLPPTMRVNVRLGGKQLLIKAVPFPQIHPKDPLLVELTPYLLRAVEKLDSGFREEVVRLQEGATLLSSYLDAEGTRAALEKESAVFQETCARNFPFTVSLFLRKDTPFALMYKMVKHLLMGPADRWRCADVIMSILKEKKVGSLLLYNNVFANLPQDLRRRLKVGEESASEELAKLRNTTTDVDLYKRVTLDSKVPRAVKESILQRIEEMAVHTTDYYKQSLYVTTLLDFPWTCDQTWFTKTDFSTVREKIMRCIHGQEEAKQAITLQVAKWLANKDSRGNSLGFVGPPGVGKSLMGRMVGKILDLPFTMITLGGQNDAELLHGHGYTYSGSSPGVVVRSMVTMGKARSILYFDELDKCSPKGSGANDVMSVLIHLTDTSTHNIFQDRFFQGINFPLDKVLFIFSYNDPSLVDPVLRDRLVEVPFHPYGPVSKKAVLVDYILPDLKEDMPLIKEVELEDKLVEDVVRLNSSDSGLRSIKKCAEKILLVANAEALENGGVVKEKVIRRQKVEHLLPPPAVSSRRDAATLDVGDAYALFVSAKSAGVLVVSVRRSYLQSERLLLTGNMGQSVKDSMHCAFTAVCNFVAGRRGVTADQVNLHVSMTDLSSTKEGASAGLAFSAAFLSFFLGRKFPPCTSFTGEVDVSGNVHPVGHVQSKVLVAQCNNMKTVVVSSHQEFPAQIAGGMEVVHVSNVSDLLGLLLPADGGGVEPPR